MTTKAEKLARELIALNERYSQKDFERASELLNSGKLFEQAMTTAQIARNVLKVGARSGASAQRTLPLRPVSGDQGRPKRLGPFSRAPGDVTNLLSAFGEDERARMSLFADQFLKREILASGSTVRAFAVQLGLQLPTKLPARANLLRTLLRQLANTPMESRDHLLKEAARFETGASSLQRWSDLIVKGEERSSS